jgi:hypothetical protein
MGPRSKISRLPPPVRAWLDAAIAENNFAQYEILENLLAEKGYTIGKSSIHRHGQQLETKLAAVRASTEAARAFAESAPDDEDKRSAAVIALLQTGLFDTMVALKEAEGADPAERIKLLAKAAEPIASLSRASIHQKKYATEVKQRAEAAARAVEKIASKGGLSAEGAAEIRRTILGIAA